MNVTLTVNVNVAVSDKTLDIIAAIVAAGSARTPMVAPVVVDISRDREAPDAMRKARRPGTPQRSLNTEHSPTARRGGDLRPDTAAALDEGLVKGLVDPDALRKVLDRRGIGVGSLPTAAPVTVRKVSPATVVGGVSGERARGVTDASTAGALDSPDARLLMKVSEYAAKIGVTTATIHNRAAAGTLTGAELVDVGRSLSGKSTRWLVRVTE